MPGQSITVGFSMGVGVCTAHDYPIPVTINPIIGNPQATISGRMVVSIGDLCLASCGHVGTVITGSTGSFLSGKGKATTGSLVIGQGGQLTGTLIVGEPQSYIGR